MSDKTDIVVHKPELTFIQKLVAIQATLIASKDKENKFGGFSYRTAEGILAAVKPHLERHSLFMSINDVIVVHGEGDRARFYLESTVTVTDGVNSKSTAALAREPLEKKGTDASQITGAASSYARKYALNGFWGIDDAKADPDANHGSEDMMAKVDTVLAACKTKEEAVAKMQAIKASKATTPTVMKYAVEEFNKKFPKEVAK